MTAKNFKALEREELSLLGEMLTDMLDIYVSENFSNPDKVTKQDYLIEDFQKHYFSKLSVEQIQKCLKAFKSKYSKTKCMLIYNCRAIDVHYTIEIEKRAFAKIRMQHKNLLKTIILEK